MGTDLIVPDMPARWDVGLLQSTFVEAEAHKITQIPLSWSGMQDQLICWWRKDGKFTVKSLYRQLQAHKLTATSSTSTTRALPWPKVGSMQTLNKIKHFLFRVLNNSLPCR